MDKNLKTDLRRENIEEIKLDKAIQNFLERKWYENYDANKTEIENSQDVDFIKISHISYDRGKATSDLILVDFQQLLSAIASKSKKMVYLIQSTSVGIDLYLGTPRENENGSFLKNTFEGIYSGSIVSNDQAEQPHFSPEMKYSKAMMGIPSLKRGSDVEYKQSLEKILFPVQGKTFRIVLVAESYEMDSVKEIISNYQELGSELHKFVKQSRNIQKSHSDSEGITFTKGTSESSSSSESKSDKTTGSKAGTTIVTTAGAILGGILAGPAGAAGGAALAGMISSNFFSATKSTSSSRTNSTNESTSQNKNTTNTDTFGITFDEINKSAEYCENLIDKYIERFQRGLNHGMWNMALYVQSDNETTLSELEHTLKSVYSGDETYFEPIRFTERLDKNKDIDISMLPMLYFDKSIIHPIHGSFSGYSSAVNTEELSILAALPHNDIDGVSVSKVSSFGLTQAKNIDKYSSIEIGNVLNRRKKTHQRFRLSLEALNSHLFVSGITGSGKSNTIKYILTGLQSKQLEHKIPFLVIEPAKSEYKHLLSNIKELRIFRPGAKDDIFKFNPFVFEHSRKNSSVTLTKHVDMLKTTFNSAFPMYGPMPYILEEAIHKIYEDKGWNFETEDHPFFTDSSEADYDRKCLLFPNMQDLKQKVLEVVDSAGYYQDLQNNIKAALKTRINNLTIGAKGKIFNSRHAFDAELLFEKPTIIELSHIVDDEEKAFLMGLLLNKLYQYKEEKGSSSRLKHITVIEEAHRLLPNISLDKSSEDASAKARAIETFTNILAEIRAYGEGIIIADQIASKLHRDVIKNTNIKIVHRTMDYEDREIIGKSINLNDDQILDVAELKAGEAIVHNRDVHQAFMVKIDEFQGDKIQNEKVDDFQRAFLSKHEQYRYELIYENYFAVEDKEEIYQNYADENELKIKLIDFINVVFFDAANIEKNWDRLKRYIGNFKNEKTYIYRIVYIWNQLNYLSNQQYYKNVDTYLDGYKKLIWLLLALIERKEEAEKRCAEFRECFIHKNVKAVFPSMRNFKNDNVDYTLLLLENITSDEEVCEYLNSVMKEKSDLNSRFDKILYHTFKTTSPELRHALGAIRSGKKEIDFSAIVKEGF